jgi:TIR domain
MAPEDAPLHVFISYAGDDEFAAGRIQADLEQRGFPIWVDTKKVVPVPQIGSGPYGGLSDKHIVLFS